MKTMWTLYSDRVAQAAGMVSVQADCSLDAAFAVIEQRALEQDRTLEEVADAVVERRIRFSPAALAARS
jgi:AmiR/NasT family two-component response regulator